MNYGKTWWEMELGITLPRACDTFTDTELQWFRGGVQVVEVVHLVTEDDIVSEEDTPTDR